MDMLSIKALILKAEPARHSHRLLLSDARKVCLDIESERSEALDVHTATSSKVIVQVFNQSFPNDQHLYIS
jgi:hypothetical protein